MSASLPVFSIGVLVRLNPRARERAGKAPFGDLLNGFSPHLPLSAKALDFRAFWALDEA
jgi:hypothetical protein